ncbi:ATP-binding cassette domain-containing protein [Yimella sp. RIT 621]|uniref:Molybdate transport system ATP-binding protein n=1 Tax=Yimella lutea TaxID=587872 RepID=A0A542EEE5_9MICO|nr:MULTISPECIES: ATP-binding cassette domain-containing protein [Yimella]RYG76608.1 ATP-binding cassette domain-containing protein [Yimella sp. RIT 621]TQJ13670.1 molybdate transport system ATP-binding protein [Yimella lutea]
MTGALSLRASHETRGLDVALEVKPGEHVAILGPNGAGKSTVLSLIAGLLRPDTGRAVLDDRTLFDERTFVPPHARGVTLLAQDPLLFPHLSVLDNVAFGPRASGATAKQARATAETFLDEVDASEFVDRRPAQLSGGQAQRVAIARALAARPSLLLLDEPMAALDVAAAPLLRRVLKRVLADRSALIVTHDVLDALLLSDRLIVLDHGRIVEDGPTQDVIARPRTPFTARIAGLNLINGTAASGTHLVDAHGVDVSGAPTEQLATGESALAVFSPNAVAVYETPPHGSPRNTFEVTVVELEPRDAQVRVRAHDRAGHTLLADLTASSVGELDLYPGKRAFYSVKATAVTIYPS